MKNQLLEKLELAFNGYNNVKTFNLPKSETVDKEALYMILSNLYRLHSSEIPQGYYSYFDRVNCAIADIGTEWLTSAGKFPKRLIRALPELEPYAGILGDEITRKAYNGTEREWMLSISQQIFWNDGNFGKKYSCWWGGFDESRTVFTDNGGIALLWHKNVDAYNGIGRAWIAQTELYDDPLLFIFNQYGEANNKPIRIEETARMLSIILDAQFIAGEFYNDYNHEIPYINGNEGYYIAPKSLDQDSIEIHVDWITEDSITCYECGDRISGDEIFSDENGRDYCEGCYHDIYFYCYRCGNEEYINDGYSYDSEMYCEHCFSRYFTTCGHCGETIPNDDAINIEYSDYCETCANDFFTPCENCGELIDNDLIVEVDNLYYCEQCAPTEEPEILPPYDPETVTVLDLR